MTTNRPQNSILVLATLGVYLGLVLAGATPQILAQAATTRLFDVKDEIEVKDDLDNKPRNGQLTSEYVESVVALLTDHLDHDNLPKIDWDKDGEIGLEGFAYSKDDDLPSYLGYGSINSSADANISSHLKEILRNLFVARSKVEKSDFSSYVADISFSISGDSVTVKTKVKDTNNRDDDVSAFFAFLSNKIENARSSISNRQKVISEHTTVTCKSDQVTIITRLPRAGLDALLATNAK